MQQQSRISISQRRRQIQEGLYHTIGGLLQKRPLLLILIIFVASQACDSDQPTGAQDQWTYALAAKSMATGDAIVRAMERQLQTKTPDNRQFNGDLCGVDRGKVLTIQTVVIIFSLYTSIFILLEYEVWF